MKAFILSLALSLSFSSSIFASTETFECKDFKGNVVSGTVARLKEVMNSRANRPQVLVTGVITKIQQEDHSGLPHQKYSLKVDSNIELLIVSNLDFGRVPLSVGKTVSVCGEFKKLGNTGMVHWTHFDPHGPHADGFTVVDGRLYGDKEVSDR